MGVIKHTPHGFDIDQPEKDSWRFARARSDIILLSSPERVFLVEHVDKELTLAEMMALLGDRVDIILTEGFKNNDYPKIMVVDSKDGEPEFNSQEKLLATVLPYRTASDVLEFDNHDIAFVTNLVVANIGRPSLVELKNIIRGFDSIQRRNEYSTDGFEKLLAESATLHRHICPGFVLGVRMAVLGCRVLGIEKPKENPKHLVVYVETVRCAANAIEAVTGCKQSKRTLKYIDYGKLAATFIDTNTGEAVRLAARQETRDKAELYKDENKTRYDAQIAAYKKMTDEDLFRIESVEVEIPNEDKPGQSHPRVVCGRCGEEISDGREVLQTGQVLCRACGDGGYYKQHDSPITIESA